MPKRWPAVGGALGALGLLLGGCGGDESSAPPRRAQLNQTTPTSCRVGERPEYFVPGPADSPLAVLGCARLGVSGKRVEFSGNLGLIGRELHLCINPAYSGRGQRAFYIPALCKLHPPPSRFAIRDSGQPRQGVRGYAFVIWGTAGSSTTHVEARYSEGTARAAVFEINSRLARSLGEPPFRLFILELPLAAACDPATVYEDGLDLTEHIPPRPKLCKRSYDDS
jgi:hypothetical protein